MAKRVYRRVIRRGKTEEKNKKIKYAAFGGGAGVFLLVLLLLLFGGKKTFKAEQGSLYFSAQEQGIIVRSERLYEAGNYGKADFIALEGQVVSAGTSIADVYSQDYSDKDYTALKELQEKILDYQQNNALNSASSKDLEALNAQVSAKAEEVRTAVVSGKGDLIALERELAGLMTDRASLLKESAKKDSQLTDFYEQEDGLKSRIETYRSTIVAEGDGLVSFYFDGIEALLTPDNMKKLTINNIKDIIAGKLNYISSEFSARPLYRLVSRNLWYVAFVSDKAVPEFENTNAFNVQFSFGEDYTYTATVYGHVEESGKHIYYLQFSDNIDKLLSTRQVSFSVSAEYVGIEVPESAIKEKNGAKGIYFKKDGVKTFEPVDILIERNGKAIIVSQDIHATLDYGSEIYY